MAARAPATASEAIRPRRAVARSERFAALGRGGGVHGVNSPGAHGPRRSHSRHSKCQARDTSRGAWNIPLGGEFAAALAGTRLWPTPNGDNRGRSDDGRFRGPVLLGRARACGRAAASRRPAAAAYAAVLALRASDDGRGRAGPHRRTPSGNSLTKSTNSLTQSTMLRGDVRRSARSRGARARAGHWPVERASGRPSVAGVAAAAGRRRPAGLPSRSVIASLQRASSSRRVSSPSSASGPRSPPRIVRLASSSRTANPMSAWPGLTEPRDLRH